MEEIYKDSSVEFKRKLIRKIKEHPNVWKKYTTMHEDWKIIEKEMGCERKLKDMQTMWASLRNLYFRKIFIRTIERNFEAPAWTFFHDMSFLYDNMKEKIQRKLGGISPPIFKHTPSPTGIERPPCPCCVNVPPTTYKEDFMTLDNAQPENEIETIPDSASEKSLEEEYLEVSDSETNQSMNSLKENEKEFGNLNSLSEPQQNEVFKFLSQPSHNQDITDTQPYEVIDLEDESEINNPELEEELPSQDQIQEKPVENPCVDVADSYETESLLQPLPNQDIINEKSSDGVIDLIDDDETNSAFSEADQLPTTIDDIARVNPPSQTISHPPQQQPVMFSSNNFLGQSMPQYLPPNNRYFTQESSSHIRLPTHPPPNVTQIATNGFSNSNGTNPTYKNTMGPVVLSINKIRSMERVKLINAVKANPVVYTPSLRLRTEFVEAWERISKEVNNIPVRNLKNRWKQVKSRYLKELVFERYSNGREKSTWECFDQLEFLRPYMQVDIDEVHTTRIQIQDVINKQIEQSYANTLRPTNASLEDQRRTEKVVINQVPSVSNVIQSAPPCQNQQIEGNCSNQASSGLQITSVESIRPDESQDKDLMQVRRSVLDSSTLPILQNRPVQITAVCVVPPLNLTNDGDPNTAEEVQPPAKKIRLSSESDKEESNANVSELAKILSAPALVSNANPDPIVEEESAPKAKPTVVHSKVFPPLDLTLDDDDDDDVHVPKENPSDKNDTSTEYQKVFVKEAGKPNADYLMLDLTQEDEDDNGGKENQETVKKDETTNTKVNTAANANKETQENDGVICLDDDDDDMDAQSDGSYEEVYVYFEDEENNKMV